MFQKEQQCNCMKCGKQETWQSITGSVDLLRVRCLNICLFQSPLPLDCLNVVFLSLKMYAPSTEVPGKPGKHSVSQACSVTVTLND